MKREGKIQNLKPFEKGQSGNPNGRPKLPDLKAAMRDILGDEKEGVTALEAILRKLRAMAAQGNMKAIELLLAYGYGKPKQQIEHTGEGGGPIQTKTVIIELTGDGGSE